MTNPTPTDQITSDIDAIQTRISSLQQAVRLSRTRDSIEDLDTTVRGMQQRIANLRQRGYAFEKELEDQAAAFVQQWEVLNASLAVQIDQQTASLQAALHHIETQFSAAVAQKGNAPTARPMVDGLKASLSVLEDKTSAIEGQIRGMYDAFANQVGITQQHLSDVEWMMLQFAEATFKLLPTESGIMAVKAVWCVQVKESKDDPEGVLYLTDQRLLFEQKQEIATKKVLFITTEKQKIQELKWEIPVATIEEIKPSKEGLLKNEDHLDLSFGSGAPIQSAHVHVWQDGTHWLQLLNRAKTKDFDQTRAIAIDKAVADKVKALPSQCPSCGGNINQVVLRGQDNVQCEYCGYTIRL